MMSQRWSPSCLMISPEKFPQDAFSLSGPGQVKDTSVIVTVSKIFIGGGTSSQKSNSGIFCDSSALPIYCPWFMP